MSTFDVPSNHFEIPDSFYGKKCHITYALPLPSQSKLGQGVNFEFPGIEAKLVQALKGSVLVEIYAKDGMPAQSVIPMSRIWSISCTESAKSALSLS